MSILKDARTVVGFVGAGATYALAAAPSNHYVQVYASAAAAVVTAAGVATAKRTSKAPEVPQVDGTEVSLSVHDAWLEELEDRLQVLERALPSSPPPSEVPSNLAVALAQFTDPDKTPAS